MIIAYGGITIAPGGLAGEPAEFKLDQKAITEQAEFFRAAAATWYHRGNISATLGFSVTRQFNTLKDAWVFLATHVNALSGRASLVLTCGEGGVTQNVTLTNAVLADVQMAAVGVSITVTYSFQGGLFS